MTTPFQRPISSTAFLSRFIPALFWVAGITAGIADDTYLVYRETTISNQVQTDADSVQRERQTERALVVLNTVTRKYVRIELNPGKVATTDEIEREFSQFLDVDETSGRKTRVISFDGPGIAWVRLDSALVNGGNHETLVGPVRRLSFPQPNGAGPLFIEGAPYLRGNRTQESAFPNQDIRITNWGRRILRLSRPFSAVANKENGNATGAVLTRLESLGWSIPAV